MIRLKDIAAKAGVSVMTVSKALRGASDISPQTKTRIKLLAQQMGYVPDSMAQGLRSRRTNLLGLVISTTANPLYARTIAALEEGAHECQCDLILAHTLGLPDREEAAIHRLLSRRVDGIFIFPVYRLAPSVAIYEELMQRQVPTVVLGQRASFCAQFVNVESDDLKGSYQMTRHLIEMGHRKIAFLSGPSGYPWAQSRLEGYLRALREQAIEPDDHLIFSAGATMEDGAKAALQMLNEGVSVTALQAAADLVAMGAANVFLNQGTRIPEDLSVAGYGNLWMGEHFRVPMTTVRQPKYRLGKAAMDLMERLRRGERPESRQMPAELVIRASTRPPAGANDRTSQP